MGALTSSRARGSRTSLAQKGEDMRRTRYDREALLFRRQFILGPRFLDGFPTWKRLSVRPSLRITAHPDLPVHEARNGNQSVVLLGYILDPHTPRASDGDIVRRLLARLAAGQTPEAFIQSTDPFGGRWILIVDSGSSVWLFNDPVGYRQVFYSNSSAHGLWCASQTGILAETLGLEPDPEARAFIRSCQRQDPQYWWPGDSSLYSEVHHLLPNHSLDLLAGMVRRFWPDRKLSVRTPEEVLAENAALLRGLVESASHRFDLALTITAGKDTRLLLAASKAIRDRIYYFTMMFWDLTWNSPDIQVPSKLLPRLGLTHQVIPCPSRMDREFREVYRRNVPSAHDVYGAQALGLHRAYPGNRVCMKGTAIPATSHVNVLRTWLKDEGGEMNPESLARVMKRWVGFPGPEEEFGLRALDRWLAGADGRNLDLLDLFYWENREGNWAAMIDSEWDLVQEVFVPFDCRLFLTNMLSVPEEERAFPACALQRELTRRMWPEVLEEPINPPVPRTLASTGRELLKRPGRKDLDWLYKRTIVAWRNKGGPS